MMHRRCLHFFVPIIRRGGIGTIRLRRTKVQEAPRVYDGSNTLKFGGCDFTFVF